MNSPLQLEKSHLIRLEIRRTNIEQSADNDELLVNVSAGHRVDSERLWRVNLKVEFGGKESSPTSPISGVAEIEGFFAVHPEFPAEKVSKMVRVNGASILYGSLRELIAGLSGRTTHGVFLLPSVSFIEVDREEERKKSASGGSKVVTAKVKKAVKRVGPRKGAKK